MEKDLILLRGLPGSGKSTMAKIIGGELFEADTYFMVYKNPDTGEITERHRWDGVYEFDHSLIKQAHEDCLNRVEKSMVWKHGRICVSNTFTKEWHMEKYYELAKKWKYRVHSLIVENRHGNENIHNVPKETIYNMMKNFEIKL